MKLRMVALIFVLVVPGVIAQNKPPASPADSLEQLAGDFWTWRAKYAPFTGDDVNRIERPGGPRDWSRLAIDHRRKDLAQFAARWEKIKTTDWPVRRQVDYRLMGSALARVVWELDINPRWKRDPLFYVEQTLTPLVEAMTVPAPYDEARSREILTRLQNVPLILQQGEANLAKPPAPFATVTIKALDGVRERLHTMASSLLPATTLKEQELNEAADRAAGALEHFRSRLQERLPSLPEQTALGRDSYMFFLRNVALLPYAPEELLAMGRQEWNRAVAFESYEKERSRNVPPLWLAKDTESWIKDAAAKEQSIREFLDKHGILTVPDWVQHYSLRAMPEYLHALEGFSETDDFTSASRLTENCIRYTESSIPRPGLFLARDRAGSPADHCPRRNPRPLLSTLPFLETRRPDPAPLLRLGRERRHRLLR